jgi:hypothetical protein
MAPLILSPYVNRAARLGTRHLEYDLQNADSVCGIERVLLPSEPELKEFR